MGPVNLLDLSAPSNWFAQVWLSRAYVLHCRRRWHFTTKSSILYEIKSECLYIHFPIGLPRAITLTLWSCEELSPSSGAISGTSSALSASFQASISCLNCLSSSQSSPCQACGIGARWSGSRVSFAPCAHEAMLSNLHCLHLSDRTLDTPESRGSGPETGYAEEVLRHDFPSSAVFVHRDSY
jgi:hypothetical protein